MLKALVVMLVGLFYGGFAVVSVLDGRALDARGKTTRIEPIEKLTETTYQRGKTPVGVSHSGEISFVTDDGQTVTVKKGLSVPQVEALTQGRPVQIRYLPDKPTTTRLEGEVGSTVTDIVIGAIAFLLGGLWFRKKLHEQPALD